MTTQTISSATSTTPIPIRGKALSQILPGFLCALSAGASLTYNVEATGDTPDSTPNTANWAWTPMTSFTGLTASADGTLAAMPTYIRARVTSYTSGTLTFQVIQPDAK